MFRDFKLSDRKIDFAIIYCRIKNYDIHLLNLFLDKLYQLLKGISKKTFRKNLRIIIPQKFPIYLVSEDSLNFELLKKNLNHHNFEFFFLNANSLQEAIFEISPKIDPQMNSLLEKENNPITIEEKFDSFLYFESFAPLLDVPQSINLILDHFTYLSEYTYSDIAIPGFLPIVCNIDLAKRIAILEKDFYWNWSELLLKNTQTVDIEIYYIEPDYRKYRLRFDLYNERYQLICKNIIEFNKYIDYKGLEIIFKNHINLLRIAPSYIEIELTTRNELNPLIYPAKKEVKDLSLLTFKKIINDLKEYQLEKAFTLSLGGTGEPFLYNSLKEVLMEAINSHLFERIYIETFFYRLNEDILNIIYEYKNLITIIIKLPTLNEELYQELMGKNILPEIRKNLESKEWKDLNIYAEILRIKQVEEELDSYFEYFKNTSIKPIIGRYNPYGNLLEDFSVVDLEPLEKDYCRSLMFHLFIDASGKVPVCRQDIFCQYNFYDVNQMSIKEIFLNLKEYYELFINKKYNKIIPLCEQCKEWFVFLG